MRTDTQKRNNYQRYIGGWVIKSNLLKSTFVSVLFGFSTAFN